MKPRKQGEKGEYQVWDWDEVDPRSLLGRLRSLPDPRRRQARVYPLAGLIAMLVLAAAAGESSLRGMWVWTVERWTMIGDHLGFWDVGKPPALTTVWKVMRKVDLEQLETVLAQWRGQELEVDEDVVAIDGKTLRGSKRYEETALQVVTAAGQDLKQILAQSPMQTGDWVTAALELLNTLPLEGKVVTMDAGMLHRSVAQAVVKKGGPTSD